MITTINVSLPAQLKKCADALVESGHYASFSDLTRTAIRDLLNEIHINRMVHEAKEDVKRGRSVALRSAKDIDEYFKNL